MTVSTATSRNDYDADGVQTVFPYTYRIFVTSDLRVYVDGVQKTLTSDYTVSGAGEVFGGNVTFLVAPANGTLVTVRRVLSITQPTPYPSNDRFPATVHEAALDRRTMVEQQLAEDIARAVKLPVSSPLGVDLVPPGAGQWLRYDATGTLIEPAELPAFTGAPVAALPGYNEADLPVGAVTGTLVRQLDGRRGPWLWTGDGWSHLVGEVLDVRRDFGARGIEGGLDHSAVAAAFAVPGAKTVLFPGPGTYAIDPTTIDAENTTVIIGAGAVVKRRTTGENWMFGVIASHVKFYGPGIIDGNRAALAGVQGVAGIFLQPQTLQVADIEDILIFGLTIRNMPNVSPGQVGDGIRSGRDVDPYTVRGLRIASNYIYGMMRNGITLTNAQHVVIVSNQLRDCEQTQIDCEGGAGKVVRFVSIEGNMMRNTVAAAGRAIDGGIVHGIIRGNIFDGNNINAIGGAAFNFATPAEDVLVESNYLYNIAGDALATIAGTARARVRGNTFHTVTHNAIQVESEDAEISDNYIYNWNTNTVGAADRAAIVANAGHAHIFGNTIEKPSGGTSTTAIALGSSGNNVVGRNRYKGDILHRVSGRVASDTVDDNLETEAKTASYNVSATNDPGKTFTNAGAAGAIQFNLPASVVGLRYRFVRVATQDLRVDPNGMEVVRGGAAGKYLQLDADGDSVMLQCVVAGTWEIMAIRGTPSYQA